MRARKPDVQRHHARLRPHPDERRERDRDLQPGAGLDRRRVADRARLREQQHRDPGADAAEMRDREVGEDRLPRRAGRRRARRGSPPPSSSVISSQPARNVSGSRAQTTSASASTNARGERRDRAAPPCRLQVARARRRAPGAATSAERAEEEPAQAVDAEARIERAREARARACRRSRAPRSRRPRPRPRPPPASAAPLGRRERGRARAPLRARSRPARRPAARRSRGFEVLQDRLLLGELTRDDRPCRLQQHFAPEDHLAHYGCVVYRSGSVIDRPVVDEPLRH